MTKKGTTDGRRSMARSAKAKQQPNTGDATDGRRLHRRRPQSRTGRVTPARNKSKSGGDPSHARVKRIPVVTSTIRPEEWLDNAGMRPIQEDDIDVTVFTYVGMIVMLLIIVLLAVLLGRALK